jgi:hypothetical protein
VLTSRELHVLVGEGRAVVLESPVLVSGASLVPRSSLYPWFEKKHTSQNRDKTNRMLRGHFNRTPRFPLDKALCLWTAYPSNFFQICRLPWGGGGYRDAIYVVYDNLRLSWVNFVTGDHVLPVYFSLSLRSDQERREILSSSK